MIKENGMIMISENEMNEIFSIKNNQIEELEIANKMLRKAMLQLTSKENISDVRVSRQDFIKMYNSAIEFMFNNMETEDNDIYGHNVTVHWHGMYCDCSDGATPSNFIIPAIKDCDNEIGEEY